MVMNGSIIDSHCLIKKKNININIKANKVVYFNALKGYNIGIEKEREQTGCNLSHRK